MIGSRGMKMDKKIDSGKKDEGYTIIPEKELKCVWMTAGLISYKLCKYNLQCERCPLDWELRNLSIENMEGLKKKTSEKFDSATHLKEESREDGLSKEDFINIKRYLFYHAGHTWIKVEKADEVRIGIDPLLSKLLRGVQVIILPLPKRRGLYGETLCSIIQDGGIINIIFPINGIILKINQKLKDYPELICKDPLEDGFLLSMKPKDFQLDQKHLIYGEDAFHWCKKEWERFKETVISEISFDQNQAELGITMQDGQVTIQEIKNLIEPVKYTQLVDNFLRKGEKIYSILRNKTEMKS